MSGWREVWSLLSPPFSATCWSGGARRRSWPSDCSLECGASLLLRSRGGLPPPTAGKRVTPPRSGCSSPLKGQGYLDPVRRVRLGSVIVCTDGADAVFVEAALAEEVMKIYLLQTQDRSGEPTDVGIVIEGVTVLGKLGNLSKAYCYLLGLCYALDLKYPKNFKCTFEAFQKVFMELDPGNLSCRIIRQVVFLRNNFIIEQQPCSQ
uniref:Uncharacterized protein n=1 Tax=Pundamilia nyererei TaxID=303518 RepID=A0A3B4HDD3_9CICH